MPLADKIRPQNLSEVVGQEHLLSEGSLFRRVTENGTVPNMIFYGPSGTGKTTVANIIANRAGMTLRRINATNASLSDVKDVLGETTTVFGSQGILLYIDEIQYFNKKQQQTLLEYIENGDITLIASTTENPYFYVYNAILSRSTVFEFKPLSPDDIEIFINRAFNILSTENDAELSLEENVLKIISHGSGGDLRKALNATELCFLTGEQEFTNGKTKITVSNDIAETLTEQSGMRYDREGDDHFDVISAYQKSMRGSDPDAALHYLARLLAAGDLQSACRRLLVTAAEDVGLAYPNIIPIVKAAVDSALMLGLPEARLPLADAVILVSISPKSNSGHDAIAAAMADVEKGIATSVPRQLQNKHFDGEDAAVKGQFYKYPHSFPNHYVSQQYLPNEIKNRTYYEYGPNKTEQSYKKYWAEIKNK